MSSLIEEKLAKQTGAEKIILFVDIDDTWKVNLKENEKDKKYKVEYFIHKMKEAYDVALEHTIPLVAVSGRSYEDIIADQQLYMHSDYNSSRPLLPFDGIYASVGLDGYTAFHKQHSIVFEKDLRWHMHLQSLFDRTRVYPLCVSLLKRLQKKYEIYFQVEDEEENVSQWEKNPHMVHYARQPQEFKIALLYTGFALDKVVEEIKKELEKHGFLHLKVLPAFSKYTSHHQTTFNIDILPASKVDAVEYVSKKYDATALFCGDSGNDLDALQQYGLAVVDPKEELAKNLKHITVEKTPHFIKIKNKDTNTTRILYKDDTPLTHEWRDARGPEVLIDALNAYLLIKKVQKAVI